jgi:hypothetical protein
MRTCELQNSFGKSTKQSISEVDLNLPYAGWNRYAEYISRGQPIIDKIGLGKWIYSAS